MFATNVAMDNDAKLTRTQSVFSVACKVISTSSLDTSASATYLPASSYEKNFAKGANEAIDEKFSTV